MTAQSSGTSVHDRAATKDELFEGGWRGQVIGPKCFAELLVRVSGAFDMRQCVRQRRASKFHSNFHSLSMGPITGLRTYQCRQQGVSYGDRILFVREQPRTGDHG